MCTPVHVAFFFLPLWTKTQEANIIIILSLSVDSASGAFATNDEGTVMDTGGKKMRIINNDLKHVECFVAIYAPFLICL